MAVGAWRAGLLALVLCTGYFVLYVHELPPPAPAAPGERLYTSVYDPPASSLEQVYNQGDGQAFAALAQDPLIERPEVFREGDVAAAYRAQRPLYGWLGWTASAGSPGAVAPGLAAVNLLGLAALVTAGAVYLERRDRNPLLALVLLLCPGAMANLIWIGPEAMGAALAVGGLLLWPRRTGWAIACFALAGLARETYLIVPAMVGLELITRRCARQAWPLAIPFGVFGAWLGFVHLRTGAWPVENSEGNLGFPFAGLVDRIPHLGAVDLLVAAGVLGVGVWAAREAADRTWRFVAAGYLLLGTLMGPLVWRRWEDFGRPLLPLCVLGLLAVMGRLAHPATTSARALKIAARKADGASCVRDAPCS